MKDLLSEETLRSALGDCKEMKILFYSVCGSTNAEAKKLFSDGFRGTALVVAEEQTAGRGRQGRAFYSPAKSGIYFTLLRTTADPLDSQVPLTCAASVALMRAIGACTGRETQIKWVNDLLLDGRKVCGILTEGLTGVENAVAIGVGINLRPAKFPPELAEIAGSLEDHNTPRAVLIAAAVRNLLAFTEFPERRDWLSDYRTHSCLIGREILFWKEGKPTPGIVSGIDEDGGLIVQTGQGTEVLRMGEITVRAVN